MRLIGYVRVSRVAGRAGESFISPAVQRDRIEAQARAHGHAIIRWEEDLDQPGSRHDRPGFLRALEAVERREADGVIVAALDRFARSVTDAAAALRRLDDAGGVLISVRDSLDTSTPVGRFARTMMLAIAELELERIRENWTSSTERAIGRGVPVQKTPVGYLRRDDKRFELDAETAPVIRELFRRRATGESWKSLCAFLDGRLPNPHGGVWPQSTVMGIIRNRTYLGEARNGRLANPDAHEPLVTRPEWEAAQAAPKLLPSKAIPSLLTGIVRCAGCRYTLTPASDGARGYHRYSCRQRHAAGICPAPATISVPKVDSYVEGLFLDRLRDTGIAFEASAAVEETEHALQAVEAAEAELVAYRDANLITVIGGAAYQEGLTARARVVHKARAALAIAQRKSAVPMIGDTSRDLLESWPGLDYARKRAILASAIDAVMVRRHGSGGKWPVEGRVRVLWAGEGPADLPPAGGSIVSFRFDASPDHVGV